MGEAEAKRKQNKKSEKEQKKATIKPNKQAHTSVTTAAAPSTTSAVTAVGVHGDYRKGREGGSHRGEKKENLRKGGEGRRGGGEKKTERDHRVEPQTVVQKTRPDEITMSEHNST